MLKMWHFKDFKDIFFFCGNADKFIVGPHVIENETLANGNDSSLVPRACTFSLFFFETFFFFLFKSTNVA